jgi:hypothetical protein
VSDLFLCSYWQLNSLISYLLDCLARDLNYGPWPVTLHYQVYGATSQSEREFVTLPKRVDYGIVKLRFVSGSSIRKPLKSSVCWK